MSLDPAAETSLRLLQAISAGYPTPFAVRLWDGRTRPLGAGGPPGFTLALKHPGAVRAMFWPFAKMALGESFVFDDFDVDGDFFAFTDWLKFLMEGDAERGLGAKLGLLRDLARLPNRMNPRDASRAGHPARQGEHSPARDKESIRYTYDLPGELYALFLDPNLQYTCGYFADPDEDLDAAQERKIDYVCRKLRLKPGERFVDFGCGWGGLLIHAARHYGVEAVGVTLSVEQVKWAEKAVAEAGLSDRVKIVLSDYRDFKAPGAFDKASSVGMSEHIGNRNLPVFLGKIYECLRPGGAYLHHAIMLKPNAPKPRWTGFAKKYVFPNGELQTVQHTLACAGGVGFEPRDVENLREHYVLTLEHWVRRLEANHARVLEWTDEVGYRVFRLYMAGATLGFRSGVYNLYQCLLSKPNGGRSGLPLTRARWYT